MSPVTPHSGLVSPSVQIDPDSDQHILHCPRCNWSRLLIRHFGNPSGLPWTCERCSSACSIVLENSSSTKELHAGPNTKYLRGAEWPPEEGEAQYLMFTCVKFCGTEEQYMIRNWKSHREGMEVKCRICGEWRGMLIWGTGMMVLEALPEGSGWKA